MQSASNTAVAPEAPQAVQQQDQTSEPAEVAPNQLDERDIYEEVCNYSLLAKLFQAENVATFVERLCKEKYSLIKPENIQKYF